MRYWLYAEPAGASSEPIWMIYSDDAVLAHYWDYWCGKMHEYNQKQGNHEGTGMSPINCIDNWVTTHWAVPATPENLLNIISAPKPQLIQE